MSGGNYELVELIQSRKRFARLRVVVVGAVAMLVAALTAWAWLAAIAQAESMCYVPVACTPTPTSTATPVPVPTPPATRIIRFTESDAVFANPSIGLQTTQKSLAQVSNPRNVPSSSMVFRFYAEEINPRAGVFNWTILDNAISKARASNQTLNIRIVTYDPYGGNWLRGSIPTIPYKCKEEGNGSHYMPDWASALSSGASKALLSELARRYALNPTVEHVDIGTLGSYGEWHNYCLVDPANGRDIPFASDSVGADVVRDYEGIFAGKQLLFVLDGFAARGGSGSGTGWRADCWGGHHEATLYPGWLTNPVDLRERWRTAPVALEPCGNMLANTSFQRNGRNITYTFKDKVDQAIAKHASLINTKNAFTYTDAQWPEVQRLLRKLGYRFVVRYAEIGAGGTTFTLENVGVAPNYTPITLTFNGVTRELNRVMPGMITQIGFPATSGTLLADMRGKSVRLANQEWNNGIAVQ